MEKIYQGRKNFVSYFRSSRPNNTLYKTCSGKSAFSDTYETLVPYKLKDYSFASVVGTSFDYLARFIIAKIITKKKDEVFKNLRCRGGILLFPTDMHRNLKMRLERELELIKSFIYGDKTVPLVNIVQACCFFARLEHAERVRWIPNENTMKHLKMENFEVVSELMKMASVFFATFVKKGMVKPSSDVVFNPSFGDVGRKLKINDADVYIDGVLWDFKTTKSCYPKLDDETQLWEYYIINLVCIRVADPEASLVSKNIKAVAFYKARFGEIEYLLIKDIDKKHIKTVENNIHRTYRNMEPGVSIDEAFKK